MTYYNCTHNSIVFKRTSQLSCAAVLHGTKKRNNSLNGENQVFNMGFSQCCADICLQIQTLNLLWETLHDSQGWKTKKYHFAMIHLQKPWKNTNLSQSDPANLANTIDDGWWWNWRTIHRKRLKLPWSKDLDPQNQWLFFWDQAPNPSKFQW